MDRCASYPEGTDEVDRAYIDSVSSIPDGSFVQGIVSVVTWVNPEGVNQWRAFWRFDAPVSQMVGLMQMGILEVLAQTAGAVTHLSDGKDE